MPLVVSSTLATDNPNVFTSISDAIDALPNIITAPTLIEVAVSGELGGIDLDSIEVKGNGLLEIINRGHAKVYTGAGNHNFTSIIETSALGWGHASNTTLNLQGMVNNLSSIDLSSTITDTAVASLQGLGDGANVSSLFNNNRCNRTFLQYMNLNPKNGYRNDKLTVGFIGDSAAADIDFLKYAGRFNVASFERKAASIAINNISDPTITGGYDVSCFRKDLMGDDGTTNGVLQYLNRNGSHTAMVTGPDSAGANPVTGNTYANTVSSISVENCNGPIYIRGFCVDGVKGADTDYTSSPYFAKNGISVKNSNITLENCSVMRATDNGAEFINSDVTLARGFFAYRNYKIESAARALKDTAGIRAINSRVELQPSLYYASGADFAFNTQAHTYGIVLDNSILTGGQSRLNSAEFDATMAFAYNDIGIQANNSVIDLSGNLDVHNNNQGMVLNNVKVYADRLTVENNTNDGILANNSEIIYNKDFVRQTYINDASGSRSAQTLIQRNGTNLHLTNSSKFTHDLATSSSNLGARFGLLRLHDPHGVVPGVGTAKYSLPGNIIDNSEANFINSRITTSALQYNQTGIRGGCVHATNGSHVNFMGSVSGATILAGPTNTNTNEAAAAYADNGSKLSFRGPTVIAQFGTGVFADNNSTVEFCPHKKSNSEIDIEGFNLVDHHNHTSVEIHTNFHSCIVANNNSQIIMEDLGAPNAYVSGTAGSLFANSDYPSTFDAYVSAGSIQFYPNPAGQSLTGDRRSLSSLSIATDNSDGYDRMRTTYVKGQGVAFPTAGPVRLNYFIENPISVGNGTTTGASSIIRDNISIGGLCVQAAGDSVVKVNSVHFPTGWVNAPGSFYDPSNTPAGCNQLRIWNIADNSKLYASHLAVHGFTPSACGHSSAPRYHGPRSVYFSGLLVPDENGTGEIYDDSGSVAVSGDPKAPDTSGISVLDTFGLGVQIKGSRDGTVVNASFMSEEIQAINKLRNGTGVAGSPGSEVFGYLHYENRGPFRLFFSPKAETRFLGYVSGTDNIHDGRSIYGCGDTKPMQHIAQGYGLSGPTGLNPVIDSVSATTDVFFARNPYLDTQHPGASSVDVSGWYYASSLMPNDIGTQVFLDETAANTFANAKHAASKAKSGRAAPRVNIYSSTNTRGGEGKSADELNSGQGLRSINIVDIRRQI